MHRNDLPQTTNGEEPIVNETDSVTVPTITKKNRPTVLIFALVVTMLIGGAVYLITKPEPANEENDSTAAATQTTTVTTAGKSQKIDPVTLPEITFDVPKGWSTESSSLFYQEEEQRNLSLLSPDAEAAPGQHANYINTVSGTEIAIRYSERDKPSESEYEKPLDYYGRGVGAPRVDDEGTDFYNRAIDFSKYYYFSNTQDVKIKSYVWAYEGCHLIAIVLTDTYYYDFSINKDGGCPETSALNTDPVLSRFINSISYDSAGLTLEPSVQVVNVNNDDPEKSPNPKIRVQAHNVAFQFETIYDNQIGERYFAGMIVPKYDSEGNLKLLRLGGSIIELSCPTCGLPSTVRSTEIRYTLEPQNMEDLVKVTDVVYGQIQPISPIKDGSNAQQYTYYKRVENGTLIINFVLEVDPIIGLYSLPSIDSAAIQEALATLTLL